MRIQITQQDGSKWEGDLVKEEVPPDEPMYVGWRCLHQAEGGLENPDHMPVVRPGLPNPAPVSMTSAIQWMSFKINAHNPNFTGNKWTSTHHFQIAFTNQNGFSDPTDPRANYVLNQDLNYPLPKLMKGILCGGNFVTGKAIYSLTQAIRNVGLAILHPNKVATRQASTPFLAIQKTLRQVTSGTNMLAATPGVDAVNAFDPIADPGEWAKIVLAKHHYFTATTRAGTKINNFPQGVGLPVYIPWILRQVTTYPLWWFERWEENYLPDPLKIYHPI